MYMLQVKYYGAEQFEVERYKSSIFAYQVCLIIIYWTQFYQVCFIIVDPFLPGVFDNYILDPVLPGVFD